ncbi:hypothetical protein [Terriglobus tenax]|uniref:hypothetical protein n=1 Tax=Terriglobus tenax TaxID=1111115 RepID=UPI0021E06ACF|nr:hypothetical protein [Terriglobus tenax]
MKLLSTLFLLASAAAPAFAQSATVNGEWALHLNVSGNEADDTCTFKQDGEKLTGTCKTFTNVTGKIAGDVITLDLTGSQATLGVSAKLEDHKIVGTVLVKEYGMEGSFTATQAK